MNFEWTEMNTGKFSEGCPYVTIFNVFVKILEDRKHNWLFEMSLNWPKAKLCIIELPKHEIPPPAKMNLAVPHLSFIYYQIYFHISELCCIGKHEQLYAYNITYNHILTCIYAYIEFSE